MEGKRKGGLESVEERGERRQETYELVGGVAMEMRVGRRRPSEEGRFMSCLVGLRIWRCRELWCGLQTWLGSGVAVALV